ncbi:hypothetical protein LJB42_003853 [Komagataella kurtzmanii]|nr:hypothetical protein LJB42_003853 [Komagataella kurtzmanii]
MILKGLVGLASALAVSKAFDLQSAGSAPEFEGTDLPGRYIIEYEEASTSAFAAQLNAEGFDFDIKYDYSSSSIFNGASVQIANDNETTFRDLQKLRSVKGVYPAQIIKLDDTLETGTSRPWNPHALTGVDALHEQGITGEGVVIAVIDTGVDYTHEAFGSGVGDSFSIKAAIDLTDETGSGIDCNGHGTFVSILIVGNTKDAIGVAPDAQIVMYKVFTECSGDTSTDLVMAGMQKAYDDGHKVISISIGSDTGFSSTPMSLMASRIAQERTLLIAAGNSGSYGEERVYPYYSYTGQQIQFSADLEIEFTEVRGCNFVANGQDNSNKAIFVRRGIGCYENIEFHNIAAGGYKAVFLYNSYGRSWYHPDVTPLFDTYIAYSVVEEEVGTWLKEETDAGNSLTVKMSTDDPMYPIENSVSLGAGKMDYYSSQGPTYELDFFPTISSPGGNSWGAYPRGEYRVGSGTSYACPYAAGVAALFEGSVGISDSQDFLKKLASAASDLDLYDWNADVLDTSFKAPLNQQGAGIINAVGLFEAQTVVVSAPFLELNDTVQ